MNYCTKTQKLRCDTNILKVKFIKKGNFII
jgi:hypothetical protein